MQKHNVMFISLYQGTNFGCDKTDNKLFSLIQQKTLWEKEKILVNSLFKFEVNDDETISGDSDLTVKQTVIVSSWAFAFFQRSIFISFFSFSRIIT